ncbi:MAG: NFACT family protein [Armatimonadota bacterium]|nr:NFACT family protein [Armatimonadota bacterium]
MTFDGLILAAVIHELNTLIVGGRVQQIRQHNATDITLELRVPGHTHLLYLSADARFPRIHLVSSSKPVPQQPPHFCMILRKHLEGTILREICQVGFDRIAQLRFARIGQPDRLLTAEIMGKHSNLILTGEDGKVIGAAKYVGASISRYRQILPGKNYAPPPHMTKIALISEDAQDRIETALKHLASGRVDAERVQKWLVDTFSGFGPFLASEVTVRCSKADAIDTDRLLEELLELRNIVLEGRFDPVLITSETGSAIMAYPIPTTQFPPEQQHSRSSINWALDTVYLSVIPRAELEDLRKTATTLLHQEIDFRQRSMESVERTVSESARAERYRQIGELILANIHTIEKGSTAAKLIDYFDPSMPEIEVELDEKLTPQQNAERYFRRYKKLRDAAASAQERRPRLAHELAELKEALDQVNSASTTQELESILDSLREQGLLKTQKQMIQPEAEFEGHQVRRITTDDGWEILYGETAEANDYLTQKIAKPNDIWMHARSIKGAHVVVRTAGKSSGVPKSVIERAALIAALNSEARHSNLVPVDYTFRKYVRKPRGSPPGFVVYRNEKTVDVSPREAQQ